MIKKILKLGAPWCGPCHALDAQLEMVSSESSVEIESVNVDENEEVAEKYNIRNIPVLIFLDENNEEVTRKVGMTTASVILEIIEQNAS